MNKTTQLKQMLLERKALACPGVYDALSAWLKPAAFGRCKYPDSDFPPPLWE